MWGLSEQVNAPEGVGTVNQTEWDGASCSRVAKDAGTRDTKSESQNASEEGSSLTEAIVWRGDCGGKERERKPENAGHKQHQTSAPKP